MAVTQQGSKNCSSCSLPQGPPKLGKIHLVAGAGGAKAGAHAASSQAANSKVQLSCAQGQTITDSPSMWCILESTEECFSSTLVVGSCRFPCRAMVVISPQSWASRCDKLLPWEGYRGCYKQVVQQTSLETSDLLKDILHSRVRHICSSAVALKISIYVQVQMLSKISVANPRINAVCGIKESCKHLSN
ncbi:uncharacterized protein [Lolium perenne]|uniref:uncharacterized protein isoform X2 n=1 Tax=Lolium perenne TaxID=4522 RepID=UPI003A98E99D